jgi:hypothetical protein
MMMRGLPLFKAFLFIFACSIDAVNAIFFHNLWKKLVSFFLLLGLRCFLRVSLNLIGGFSGLRFAMEEAICVRKQLNN